MYTTLVGWFSLSVNYLTKQNRIDPLYKWRLNLNKNTLYILILAHTHVSRQRIFFHMNVRLRIYKYCSNLGAIFGSIEVVA